MVSVSSDEKISIHKPDHLTTVAQGMEDLILAHGEDVNHAVDFRCGSGQGRVHTRKIHLKPAKFEIAVKTPLLSPDLFAGHQVLQIGDKVLLIGDFDTLPRGCNLKGTGMTPLLFALGLVGDRSHEEAGKDRNT